MIRFDGLAAFIAVADAGSISEAARRLGLAKSVVSERLAEVERVLGVLLMQRTTRKLSLTEDGIAFLARARRIEREMADAKADIAERRGTLSGPLRLAGPVGFGSLHLGPALYAFLRENPEIELTLDLDDRFIDIAAEGFDAVVRHGAMTDSRLVTRRLAPSRRVLVASPAYLSAHGTPRSVEELRAHSAILYTNRETDWRFSGQSGEVVVRPRARLRVNNGIVMRDAAIAGLGIALMPTFFIGDAVAAGQILALEVGREAEGAELFLAYPRNRSASAKIGALVRFLREAFGDPPYWDVPPPDRALA